MCLSPLPHDTPTLNHRQVHQSAIELLTESFDQVQINGYQYTSESVWDVLLYASANRCSINASCDALDTAPSANGMYTVLEEEVLERYPLERMEQQANQALKQTFPKRLTHKPQKVAIDLVLIPYYGSEATEGIRRSQAKKSTTKFFCYASAYLIKKHKRVTLCFTYVQPEDTLLGLLQRLLKQLDQLDIRLKRLYLDRGFAQVSVLQYLKRQSYGSVLPVRKRGKRLKALQRGKRSFQTEYTMHRPEHGSVTFPLWVACRYQKGKAKKHGVAYLFFAVLGACKSPILQVAEAYRHRFGIEASYRLMNAARAATTSSDATLRLLLVALAFLLTNLWVWFKWNLWLLAKRKQQPTPKFSFRRFELFITEAIKQILGVSTMVKL